MESSNSKYLTTPVGTIDPAGKLVAGIEARGCRLFPRQRSDSRLQYGGAHQSDDREDVFWSANE
jgi:hypothetical protein